ncbi:MAG TPA: DUF885 domain-containing protein [Thermoplasmata archaeon]|nr:DUF885 domain-containing protein [Thermoplasmata archaeon]
MSPSPLPSDDALAEIEREVIDHVFELHPGYAITLGRHEYDGRLARVDRESTDRWLAGSDRLLQRLRDPELERLAPGRRLDRTLLDLLLDGANFDLRERGEYDRNPMVYLGALSLTAYTVRPYAPLSERASAMVHLLEQVPRWLSDGERRLLPSIPLPFLDLAANMGAGLPAHFAECEKLVRAELPLLAEPLGAARSAADEALRHFLAELETRFRPRASPDFALGRKLYQRLLWVREGMTLTPEELRAWGEADLRKNRARLEELAHQASPPRSASELVPSVTSDHGTAAELIPTARNFVAEAERWLRTSGIISVPSTVLCRVEETPIFGRALSTASMDSPGPFEGEGADGVYYVTPVDPAWSPTEQEEWLRSLCRPILRNITVHEVYPGHYLQFLHLRQSAISLTRRVALSTSFVEGWAHYCEQLAIEERFGGSDPAFEAVQLQDALLRDCRLISSVGLHCQGMSLEESAALFQREALSEPLQARREAIRGSFDPDYFGYTLGKLEILRQRAARLEPGPEGLRRFHDRLLSFGCPPVGLLDTLFASVSG